MAAVRCLVFCCNCAVEVYANVSGKKILFCEKSFKYVQILKACYSYFYWSTLFGKIIYILYLCPEQICITDCSRHDDGDYQSCLGCYRYVTCTNGNIDDSKSCGNGLIWDDKVKECVQTSSTCNPQGL